MSSEVDIAADRAIIAAATPGPWRQSQNNEWRVLNDRGMLIGDAQLLDNTIFIAAARTRWTAALDEIERLRADNDTLRAKADSIEDQRCEAFGYARDMDAATAMLENRITEQAAEIERLRATLATHEATIGELRAGLENLRGAVAGVFDFGACYGSRRDFERAASAADALLAKTAPPKEGT